MLHLPPPLSVLVVTERIVDDDERFLELLLLDHFTIVGLRATTGLGFGLSRRFA